MRIVKQVLALLIISCLVALLVVEEKGVFLLLLPVLMVTAHFFPIDHAKREEVIQSSREPLDFLSSPLLYLPILVIFVWAAFSYFRA